MTTLTLNGYKTTVYSKRKRLYFPGAAFALKDELKAMAGSTWKDNMWSVKDCGRNWFQLRCLMGEPVYDWFDQPIKEHEGLRPELYEHQRDLANLLLTKHFQIWAADMGVGKSLAAQSAIEVAGGEWYWVCPAKAVPNIRRELNKWDCTARIHVCSYDKIPEGTPLGVVFDEHQKVKNPETDRAVAAQALADRIRAEHGMNGFVLSMSGTWAPKSPLDWWSPCEIVWPGFLREGSIERFRARLANLELTQTGGVKFNDFVSWKEDEVAFLDERLKGLATRVRKDECLDLPEKTYRTIECKPSESLLRVKNALCELAPSAIQALIWCRELSDGFQYKQMPDGLTECPHCDENGNMWYPETEQYLPCAQCGGSRQIEKIVREVYEVPCPKDEALVGLLEECEPTGRIVIFAGFQGSLDKIARICRQNGWEVIQCDGRGFRADDRKLDPLDVWHDSERPRVAYVAHPISGGVSQTLVESQKAVFYSNDFNAEGRSQAEDRIHRIGCKAAEIVDLVHLDTDLKVRNALKENRRLELMTMGELAG